MTSCQRRGNTFWPVSDRVGEIVAAPPPYLRLSMEPTGIEPVTSCLQRAWDEALRCPETSMDTGHLADHRLETTLKIRTSPSSPEHLSGAGDQ
jgi:hypothetical protein